MNNGVLNIPVLRGAVSLDRDGFNLFLIGFIILFFELACIRWFSAYVVFLQFFTNIVLIAAFLGMSVGCVCADGRTDWLRRFPPLTLLTMLLAVGLTAFYRSEMGFAVDVAGQNDAPQVVFFGTEYRDVDFASFAIPMEMIVGLFFVLVTLMFVGPGQVLGRCFDAYPNRVMAYLLNIAGSLFGILCFALASFAEAPPFIWFGVSLVGIGYFLWSEKKLSRHKVTMLAGVFGISLLFGFSLHSNIDYYWSPYYWIQHNKSRGTINANNIGFQSMVPVRTEGAVYSLPHLLNRDAGGEPFEDVLIIGAGSGNDVAAAAWHGASKIDAVEIDPVIARLGKRFHPDRPYHDPRVSLHLNDGRNHLREISETKDLIVYALLDSLILHSSVSNVRLESFLFTEEAFRDIKQALKPDGMFVAYNYLRQGWIVHRIAGMIEDVFGTAPIVITLPNTAAVDDTDSFRGFTVLLAGNTEAIRRAFAENGRFWLHSQASRNEAVNGFGQEPPEPAPAAGADGWNRIAPAVLTPAAAPLQPALDNWPFLYLRDPSLPAFYLKAALLMAGLGLAIYFWQTRQGGFSLNGRMLFLGAGFLLLETKAVVHMALVFGSTWVVNSLVFAAVLVMILAANTYVLRARSVSLGWHYGLLFATLALNVVVPLDTFLAGGILWRYVAPCVLVMSPIFFAGVIFAVSFRASLSPHRDFGANVAGAVIGGFSEYLSMLLGFQYLLIVAVVFYGLSACFATGKRATVPKPA